MASKNPKDLVPEMQVLYAKFKEEMDKAGLDFVLTCTFRSEEEQLTLWNQGRNTVGKIVTWLKHGKHQERKAFDIAIITDGKLDWRDFMYAPAGKIGESVGLVWGGIWKVRDLAHFQLKEAV